MADSRLTGLSALTAVAAGDLFYVVDISDTTDDAAGSSKKITQANLVGAFANTFVVGQTIAPAAATGSPAPALLVTGAAHTALTASTENIGVNLNLSATKQFAAGTVALQREVLVQAPTYSFASGSNTITTAATVDVTGPPIAGTNCAGITNAYAARLNGKTRIQDLEFYSGGGIAGINCLGVSPLTLMYNGGVITAFVFNGVDFGNLPIRFNSTGQAYLTSATVAIICSAVGVLEINNTTTGQWAQLKLGTYDSGTTSITDGLTVGHRSSGTPAAGLGSAILFNIDSSTTADQAAGRLSFSWATATHASRLSKATLSVYDVGTEREAIACTAISGGISTVINGKATINKIGGTSDNSAVLATDSTYDVPGLWFAQTTTTLSNQTVGGQSDGRSWLNSPSETSIRTGGTILYTQALYKVGIGGYADISTMDANAALTIGAMATDRKALVVKGIASQTGDLQQWQDSSANVLGSVAITGAALFGNRDAGTTTITDGLTVKHNSSGTPAAGLGSAILFNIDSSTTADQAAGRLSFSWATATHASRKARATLSVYDTAEREGMRIEADGSNPMIGFLGATAVVRQTSGANLTNNVTSGGTDDTIADYSDLVVYANDAAAIRNDIYQLARKLKQVNDALRAFGLLT